MPKVVACPPKGRVEGQSKGLLPEVKFSADVKTAAISAEVVPTPQESKMDDPAAAKEKAEKKEEVGPTPKELKISDLKRKLMNFKAKAQDQKVRGENYCKIRIIWKTNLLIKPEGRG